MRNINQLLPGLALACVGMLLLAANAAAQEARILKIVGSGSATVTVAGQTLAARESMSVPLDAEITTSTQEVYLEVIPGVVATVKPRSSVRVDTLEGPAPALELREGAIVTEIDKKRVAGKTYRVKTAHGVAAARGTSFTVSLSVNGFAIATTADRVEFTTPSGASVEIQAGMISITPAGSTTPAAAVPLAMAAAANAEVAGIVRDAVQTVATVVQNNLGGISAEAATNLVSQVVAVAVAALPAEATTFTTQAISAVTASGSATATTAETAAGSVTAAAVQSAPDQAAGIAGAAAEAAPGQSGVITAVAQQVAPKAKDAITLQVANTTGKSSGAVQTNANASAGQARAAVNAANAATSNVVSPPVATPPPQATSPGQSQGPKDHPVTPAENTPTNPIDPSANVSRSH